MPTPTFTDYLQLGLGGMGLIGQGMQSGRSAENDAYQRLVDTYNRITQARSQQLAQVRAQEAGDLDRAIAGMGAMPLGAEQAWVQRNSMMANAIPQFRGIGQGLQGGPITNPFVGMSTVPFESGATAAAIAQRRKAIAGVNPDMNFGSMASYGLGEAGTAADADVTAYAAQAALARNAQRQAQQDIADAQMAEARGFDAQQATPAPAAKKKTSIWKKIGKAALMAAPIVAAPFTGGASLAAIGALSGAASGVLSGGGLKGAILGGAMGAIPMPGAGAAARGATETASAAVKRAIMNPAALARVAGAGVGGKAEAVANLAAPFMGGIKPFSGPTLNRAAAGPVVSNFKGLNMQVPTLAARNLANVPSVNTPAPVSGVKSAVMGVRRPSATPSAASVPLDMRRYLPDPQIQPPTNDGRASGTFVRRQQPPVDRAYANMGSGQNVFEQMTPEQLQHIPRTAGPAANLATLGAVAAPAAVGGLAAAPTIARLIAGHAITTLGDLRVAAEAAKADPAMAAKLAQESVRLMQNPSTPAAWREAAQIISNTLGGR